MTVPDREEEWRSAKGEGRQAGGRIGLLLSALPEELHRLVDLCAIPHRFNREIVGVLMSGVPKEEVDERYERLLKLAIVDVVEDGFMLHDRVRSEVFAWWLEGAARNMFRHASKRLADLFGKLKGQRHGGERVEAEQQYIFHLVGADFGIGFREFVTHCERERARLRVGNCEVLVAQVEEYGNALPTGERAQLAFWGALLMADRRRWEEARTAFEKLRLETREMGDLESRICFRLGLVSIALREYERAVREFSGAEKLAYSAQRRDGGHLARIHSGMGSAYRELGEASRAVACYERSIEEAEIERNEEALMTAFNGLGLVHRRRGDTALALEAFERALAVSVGDFAGVGRGRVCNNVGLAYADRGEWKASRDYFGRGLKILRDAGDSVGEAEILKNLMRTYVNVGAAEEVVECGVLASELFARTREWTRAGETRRFLLDFWWGKGRLEEAKRELERTQECFRRAERPDLARAVAEEYGRLGLA